MLPVLLSVFCIPAAFMCFLLGDFRGDVYSGEIQESLLSVKQQKAASFVDWIPTAFKASLSPVGPLVEAGGSLRAPNRACCLIANHTANALQIKRTVEDAKKMLAKRAFVFRYTASPTP